MFIDFLERQEGRGRDGEREKHPSVASCVLPTGDGTRNFRCMGRCANQLSHLAAYSFLVFFN